MEDELYKEIILDHSKNPQNKRKLSDASCIGFEENPLCGDSITIFLCTDSAGYIEDCTFTGEGCAISQASASFITEYAKGKPAFVVTSFQKNEIERLLGIPLSIVRARCALLPIQALRNACGTRDAK